MLKRYQIICREKDIKYPCKNRVFPMINQSRGKISSGRGNEITIIETPGWTKKDAINRADVQFTFDQNNLQVQSVHYIGPQRIYTLWMNILRTFRFPKYVWNCCGNKMSVRKHERNGYWSATEKGQPPHFECLH